MAPLRGQFFCLQTMNPRDCVVWFARYLRRGASSPVVHGFPTSKELVESPMRSGIRML